MNPLPYIVMKFRNPKLFAHLGISYTELPFQRVTLACNMKPHFRLSLHKFQV